MYRRLKQLFPIFMEWLLKTFRFPMMFFEDEESQDLEFMAMCYTNIVLSCWFLSTAYHKLSDTSLMVFAWAFYLQQRGMIYLYSLHDGYLFYSIITFEMIAEVICHMFLFPLLILIGPALIGLVLTELFGNEYWDRLKLFASSLVNQDVRALIPTRIQVFINTYWV